MNKKEVIQEKIKNNWELAKSLATFATVSLAGSVAALIKLVETGNRTIIIISFTGAIIGLFGIIFLILTYIKSLRLINQSKEN